MPVTLDPVREASRREALAFISGTKIVDGKRADALIDYWQKAVSKLDDVEEEAVAKDLVGELKRDTDMLKELRLSVRMKKDDPVSGAVEAGLSRLLHVLDLILEQMQRRWWLLRHRLWAQWFALNPAFPRRHQQHDKKKPGEQPFSDKPLPSQKKKDEELDEEIIPE